MDAGKALKELQLQGKRSRVYISSEAVLLLLTIAAGLVVIRLNLQDAPKGWLDALAAFSALIGAFGAYKQWRAGRQESSFDKYYERLESTNDRFSAWREKALAGDPVQLLDHLKTMYVFSELDNLEYIIEKYKLAYVKQDLVERALCAFHSRCRSDADFVTRALRWVGEGHDATIAGYQETTRRAVRYIADHRNV